MAVEILSTTTLKPSPTPPSNPLHNTHIPLTIFDKAALNLHVAIIYAFRPPMPTNDEMKSGLAKALTYFPHLAGRLSIDEQHHPCFVLNNAGIRLIETQIEMTLIERLPLDPSTDLRKLYPTFDGVDELLQIQLNRFSCGGLLIGLTAHHRVADGQSMSSFFLAWAKLVRGLDVDPLPYHDRAAISVPRNPPRCDFNHQVMEFRENTTLAESPTSNSVCLSYIENLVVHFSGEFIARLKTHVNPGHQYSTFECLMAHLWKKITLARGQQDDELTQVKVAVNGRARIKPTVPMEYFGNLVLWAYPKLKVGELLSGTHASAAKVIHDAVARINDAYFKSFIDFGEVWKGGEGREEMAAAAPCIGNSLCPDLEVDSWLRFQFHDLDFGGGGPCAFLPPNLPVEGLLILIPSCEEKGGIDVFMALLPHHVDHFKQICHCLD
ncbi:tryptamine hydroxycinnamoyltransferase 2-like [Magnolia sinica]|uniref:tryptamine hydroxycinnamoyltransferase 2-like n=1 Tax=Magnolia sinica TaxID=86752 RepID=UPI00265B20F6|nr:tryptamine hydroxycinnamoyltransferase 2-like [Magnolia sinica]